MPDTIRILLISGSMRAASTNGALLRTAQLVAPPGVTTTLFEGLTELPPFNPDDDREPPSSVGGDTTRKDRAIAGRVDQHA
jgi:NAD(P)H-dependent FMN reductase